MKIAKFESDYALGCYLKIIQNNDGDIVINISGEGECRIATDGGKLHGETMVQVTKKFSELIDLLNTEN